MFGLPKKRTWLGDYEYTTEALSALSVHSCWEHQPVASYSAGRDIAAELISEPSTGTNSDITATDQIRPIATTTAIPIIHARICIPPLRRAELGDRVRIFFAAPM